VREVQLCEKQSFSLRLCAVAVNIIGFTSIIALRRCVFAVYLHAQNLSAVRKT